MKYKKNNNKNVFSAILYICMYLLFKKNPNNFLFFQIQIRSIMNDDFRSQFVEDKISRFGNL